MTEKYLLTIFVIFILVMAAFTALDSYFFYSAFSNCNQMPSRSVLDSAHAQEDMRVFCGLESSFIPEFCADKLGRSTNSIPALLMKR